MTAIVERLILGAIFARIADRRPMTPEVLAFLRSPEIRRLLSGGES